jgi:hypothetical protein
VQSIEVSMIKYPWDQHRVRHWSARFIPKLGKHMGTNHGIGGVWFITPNVSMRRKRRMR